MSNKSPHSGQFYKTTLVRSLFFCLIACAAVIEPVFASVAEETQDMSISLPKRIHAGQDIRISVLFRSHPKPHQFFQMEIDIDGKPSALADLSIGNKTEVDIPPLPPGMHTLRVVWKNAPTRPITIEKMVTVTGHPSTHSTGGAQP
ncbi:MAG: hypothetical protein ACYCYP_04390 [Leptospirales bacterium]